MKISKKSYCKRYDVSYPLFFYYQRKRSESESKGGFHELVLHDVRARTDLPIIDNSLTLHVQFTNGSILHFPEYLLERVIIQLQSR
jgi:hypothetical protein